MKVVQMMKRRGMGRAKSWKKIRYRKLRQPSLTRAPMPQQIESEKNMKRRRT